MKKRRFIFLILFFMTIAFYTTPEVCAEEEKESDRIIVSLGDSYASGEGIEPFFDQDLPMKQKVKKNDWLAHRSRKAWSSMLCLPNVEGNMGQNKGKHWFFRAASGAETIHMTEKQKKSYDKTEKNDTFQDSKNLPKQLSVFDTKALKGKKVDYVTISIGGNDLDFSGIVRCMVFSNRFTHYGILRAKLFNAQWKLDYGFLGDKSVKSKLKETYEKIQKAAGEQTVILVTGYPKLFDEHIPRAIFSKREAKMVNDKVSYFNTCLKDIVKELQKKKMKIEFVSVEEAFDQGLGHGAYSVDPWINGIILGSQEQDLDSSLVSSYSVHPNEKGARAYAECVQKKINELEGVDLSIDTTAAKDNENEEWRQMYWDYVKKTHLLHLKSEPSYGDWGTHTPDGVVLKDCDWDGIPELYISYTKGAYASEWYGSGIQCLQLEAGKVVERECAYICTAYSNFILDGRRCDFGNKFDDLREFEKWVKEGKKEIAPNNLNKLKEYILSADYKKSVENYSEPIKAIGEYSASANGNISVSKATIGFYDGTLYLSVDGYQGVGDWKKTGTIDIVGNGFYETGSIEGKLESFNTNGEPMTLHSAVRYCALDVDENENVIKYEVGSIVIVDQQENTDNSKGSNGEELYKAKIGDTITFGKYEQDNNTNNGKEKIEWIVLNKKNGKLLVVSKYALDCQPYNKTFKDVTWENSTIRKWLNNSFYNTSFSTSEKKKIKKTKVINSDSPFYGTEGGNDTKDNVFLLSVDEALKFFKEDNSYVVNEGSAYENSVIYESAARACKATPYAKANSIYETEYGQLDAAGYWLLRSPGVDSSVSEKVGQDGVIFNDGKRGDRNQFMEWNGVDRKWAIRPAMWISQ